MTLMDWNYILSKALCGCTTCADCKEIRGTEDTACPGYRDRHEMIRLLSRLNDLMMNEFYPDDDNPFPAEITDEDFVSVFRRLNE